MRAGVLVVGVLLALGSGTRAEELVTCTAEPRDKWIAEPEMKSRATAMGYKAGNGECKD